MPRFIFFSGFEQKVTKEEEEKLMNLHLSCPSNHFTSPVMRRISLTKKKRETLYTYLAFTKVIAGEPNNLWAKMKLCGTKAFDL